MKNDIRDRAVAALLNIVQAHARRQAHPSILQITAASVPIPKFALLLRHTRVANFGIEGH